jgi:spore coat polysaccharide biosynthesis protein SpsF
MIVGIVQARSSSTRLPGKVMLPILGVPMILRQFERLQHSEMMQNIALATSTDASDDGLADTVARAGFAVIRGSLQDVLDRFLHAANTLNATTVVRLTGDCPLADPQLIDQLIQFHQDQGADYSSLCLKPTFPDGLDAEVCTIAALRRAHSEAKLPSEREHVTPYLYKHPELFKIASFENSDDFSSLRWTVDEPADFDFVSRIYTSLYPTTPQFRWHDVLAFLQANPSLASINGGILRNEGYLQSQRKDLSQ